MEDDISEAPAESRTGICDVGGWKNKRAPLEIYPDSHLSSVSPFSLREKVAEGRMRGQQCHIIQLRPLTLALSLRERGLSRRIYGRSALIRKSIAIFARKL